ncbi:hypothetical protein DAI22_08g184533 [Oryza sativa Japonica Group]|nr:hypothetical protein DAI22_08g184533 [Oryza sativa Japonica Group]
MDVEQLQQHARRLLSNGRVVSAAAAAGASPGPAGRVLEGGAAAAARRPAPFSSLDATVITVLSLLLCVLVVGLVLHAIARCAFRVTRRMCYGQEPPGDHGDEAAAERCARVARKKPGRAIAEKIPAIVCPAGGLDRLAGCGSTECAICLSEFAQVTASACCRAAATASTRGALTDGSPRGRPARRAGGSRSRRPRPCSCRFTLTPPAASTRRLSTNVTQLYSRLSQ